jgi:putative pyruvate formate lyase activating enzyme
MNEVFKVGDEMVVMDPNPDAIPFLRGLDPGFAVKSKKPPLRFIPRFQTSRDNGLLEENVHKALGMMYRCELCPWQCKANRFREKGKCGLSDKIYYYTPFVHIAEEAVINPALVINFTNCSMDCVYCVRHNQANKETHAFEIDGFWKKIESLSASFDVCSLEFAGGDPTIYLPWALSWLKYAPDNLDRPVVWNSNLFMTQQALSLLDGVVDVYLPDFAFGNDQCAKRLAGVDNYLSNAMKALESMIKQNARVIVRMLVLPGHADCCHKKALEWLGQYKDRIWVSILDQYVPAHKAKNYQEIFRRPALEEIKEVEEFAEKQGLRNIKECPDFWEKIE